MPFCISSLIIWKHFSSYDLMRGLILFITNLNNSSGCYARKVVVWLFLREEVCWKSYWFHQTKLDRRAVVILSFLTAFRKTLHLRCLTAFLICLCDFPGVIIRKPANIYLFKVNNKNIRKRCEICSKLTIKPPERRYWRSFSIKLWFLFWFSFLKVW